MRRRCARLRLALRLTGGSTAAVFLAAGFSGSGWNDLRRLRRRLIALHDIPAGIPWTDARHAFGKHGAAVTWQAFFSFRSGRKTSSLSGIKIGRIRRAPASPGPARSAKRCVWCDAYFYLSSWRPTRSAPTARRCGRARPAASRHRQQSDQCSASRRRHRDCARPTARELHARCGGRCEMARRSGRGGFCKSVSGRIVDQQQAAARTAARS